MTVEIRDTSVETNKEMDKTNEKVASLENNSPIRSFIIRKIFDSYNYLILFSYNFSFIERMHDWILSGL